MNKYIIAFLLLLLQSSANAQHMGGIGAQLILDTAGGSTMPRIMRLVPGTPADSNLKATDYIYKVNDASCKNITLEEVVNMIRGEIGTEVKITVTDTKDGKRPRTYNLTRRGVQGVTNQSPDPAAAFNSLCGGIAQQLSVKGFKVIKTFDATCGNRFFNFEAAPRAYHILVMTLDSPGAAAYSVTARVFDNDNESAATPLTNTDHKSIGTMNITEISGDVVFKKSCIGVVNVKAVDTVAGCSALHVIVYR